MISIPVRLYKAARRERIRFHRVYRPAEIPEAADEVGNDSDPPESQQAKTNIHELPRPVPAANAPAPETVARVRNMAAAEMGTAQVPPSQVLKGFEIEKDRYVTFEPGEVAAVRAKTSTELGITEFVRLQEIDPIFFETSYYAIPDRGGEKPYALLFAALSETNYAAIGSLAMHGRTHATVIRPGRRGLILHTLFYEKEVRAEEEFPTDPTLVNPKELDLAKTVIRAMAAPFDPSALKDEVEERLQALIDARAETAVPRHSQSEIAKPAPLLDIMEALRKSLAAARKPPKSVRIEAPAKPAKSKDRRRRAGS
jgi:DNA end-binding protein Ku